MTPLEGTWRPIHAELGGETAPAEVLEQTLLIITAGKYAVKFGGQVADQGEIMVDAEGLTLLGIEGTNAGRTLPCLYKQKGNRLRICFGLDGVRPPDFAPRTDSRHYLVDYKRVS